jgi:hypothetical protein
VGFDPVKEDPMDYESTPWWAEAAFWLAVTIVFCVIASWLWVDPHPAPAAPATTTTPVSLIEPLVVTR